ncbi:hypothetical protein HJC23_005011 [Cyclotella cryptica]|uniref:Zinc finger PHD-type domain-containing protein n=1 Tax=Cyclotella cryptica TaxID=29204 RepID=A0ABD3QEL7_9STRA|eukprot:CCRYP_006227-RA/>CCRYP_006227-RA protein AED:0.26 eAED:-0.19 QI:0/-1/0/1/-1/1/1/0/1024
MNSNASWLYQRCLTSTSKKPSSSSSPDHAALQLSIKTLDIIRSSSTNDGITNGCTSTTHSALYAASRDLKFVLDVIQRIEDFCRDEELNEEALAAAAAAAAYPSSDVGDGLGDESMEEGELEVCQKNGIVDEDDGGDADASIETSQDTRTDTDHIDPSNGIYRNLDGDGMVEGELDARNLDGMLGEEKTKAVSEIEVGDGMIEEKSKVADEAERDNTKVLRKTKQEIQTDDDVSQHIDPFELHCFQLRTKVLGLSLPTFTTELWKYLQMAGWTYVLGTYRPPKEKRGAWSDPEAMAKRLFKEAADVCANVGAVDQQQESDAEEGPEVFETANQIVEYLDQYCLPDYCLTPIQIRAERERLAQKSAAYERRCKRLRYDLLEIAYRERLRQQLTLSGEVIGMKSKYGHNHRPCEVCFEGAHPKYPRVACRDCGLVVHTQCYGLSDYTVRTSDDDISRDVDEKGFFQCEVCKAGLATGTINKKLLWNAPQNARWRAYSHPNAMCQLCDSKLISGGMIRIMNETSSSRESTTVKRRRSRENQIYETWVHIYCYNVMTGKGYKYMSQNSEEVIDRIMKVKSTTLDVTCQLCPKLKKGLIVECQRKCGKYFHPICLQVDQPKASRMKGKVNICGQCAGISGNGKALERDRSSPSLPSNISSDPLPNSTTRGALDSDQYFMQPLKKKALNQDVQHNENIAVPPVRTSIEEARKIYYAEKSEAGLCEVESQYGAQFREWALSLSIGQSILLYGLGSKRCILESFGDALAAEGNVIMINGYDVDLDLTEFLDLMAQIVSPDGSTPFDHSSSNPSEVEIRRGWVKKSVYIAENYSEDSPLFVLLHNIDGKKLSSWCVQEALATLTAKSKRDGFPMIRIAASIDDINRSMFWDPHTENKFNWVWKLVHTYRPHFEEFKHGPQEGFQKKTKKIRSNMQDVAVKMVLKSLASKHKDVVKLLATLQSRSASTISYAELKDACLKNLIVASDSTLRAVLKELKDHGMLQFGRTGEDLDERESAFIPSNEMLHEILTYDS